MALSTGGHTRYALTCFLLIFLSAALASPTKKSEISSRSLQPRAIIEDGVLDCQTERSGDYYGLGVRLGIYLAWFQSWIANVCVPSEIAWALDTNAIFLFAVLVSMVRCAVSTLLLQLDGLILMHLGGGTIFSVLSVWGYRTCVFDVDGPTQGIKNFGGWGTHFRLLLCMGVSTFGLFFWGWGIKGELLPDTDPGCEIIYTFMFSKLRADGGIRIFYIFICVSCMLYFGSMLLASLVAVPDRLKRYAEAHKRGDNGDRTRRKFATGLNQKQLRQIFYFLRIGNFVFIIYSMLLVEFSLNYNNVAGVLGWRGHVGFPAQVIPMVIGSFGFCRVLWIRYRQWKSPDYMQSDTGRTLLNSDPRELVKMYTPKSNISMEFAKERDDKAMDPLMKGQPLWLRLLVSWLPWLAVLRWWNPDYDDDASDSGRTKEKDPESPSLTNRGTWSSSESTPKMGGIEQRNTWASGDTASTITELPQIPKNIARFGILKA